MGQADRPRDNLGVALIGYLKGGKLLEDKNEAKKVKIKVARYTLVDEILYKRSFTLPLL